ncbi:MAG TPA: hypothetical protein VJ770_29960 [Stellaceae bacterium]|nr:hypothetical protein [Stellaceae bacterium]
MDARVSRFLLSVERPGQDATEILESTAAAVAGWIIVLLPVTRGAAIWRAPSAAAKPSLARVPPGANMVLGTARHSPIPAVFGVLFGLGHTVAVCLACRSAPPHLDGRMT